MARFLEERGRGRASPFEWMFFGCAAPQEEGVRGAATGVGFNGADLMVMVSWASFGFPF